MNKSILMTTLLLATGTTFGGDWMQWRGPKLNGTCEASNLPVSWAVENKKNVAWTCDLPGTGSSTPIIVGHRIFLTASTPEYELYAIAIDRKTGVVDWKEKLGTGRKSARGNNMASPSAVSNGEQVYFLFGQGTLAAMSLDGQLLWKRELETDLGMLSQKFGFSSSPLLHDDTLYIPLLYLSKGDQKSPHPGTSLLAIDAKTGAMRWSVDRPTPALKESLDSYMTPIVWKGGIILTGGDLVTSHNPDTGLEQWRFDFAEGKEKRKTNWRIIASPVEAGDLVVTPYPRGRTLVALKPDGTKAWDYEGYVPDVCTPAHDQGLLYVLDGKKRYLTCLDTKSGAEIWQEKIPSDKGFYASPLVADGKVYTINLGGEVFVFSAGRKTQQLARFSINAKDSSASIIAADNALFVRTPDQLICVQKTK